MLSAWWCRSKPAVLQSAFIRLHPPMFSRIDMKLMAMFVPLVFAGAIVGALLCRIPEAS